MPYVFTPPQQVQIETLYQAGPLTNQPGNFSPMYSYISNTLTTGSPSPDSDAEVMKSRLWFDGATKANAGQGVFSILIRDYTQTEGELHFGARFSTGTGAGGIQEASNNVARNVHADIVGSSWALPTIGDIANNDASAIGNTLFSTIPTDTAFTNNAAWSGAILLGMLGSDQTWRWVGTQASPVVDTLDDYRNLFFGRMSYEKAFTSALVYSPYEVIQNEEFHGLLSDMKTYAETCFISGAYGRSFCSPLFLAMIKGSVVESAFGPEMSLSSGRVLNLMQSGYTGTVVSTSDVATVPAAHSFFQPVGVQGQSAPTSVLSVDALYSQAIGAGAPALEARQALQALSPFVISGGGSPTPAPSLALLTPEYLSDRRDMLKVRLDFDAGDVSYTDTLSSSIWSNGTQYVDDESALQLAIDNPLSPFDPKKIHFGSGASDFLQGGSGDDRLYGGDGNDTLVGNGGADYLEGGAGSDDYYITSSGATVVDEDGLGAVHFNSAVLAGGARKGADIWQSADNRFLYARTLHDGVSVLRVVDLTAQESFEIRDFVSGDLGIALADSGNPTPATDTIAPEDASANGVRDVYEGSTTSDLIRSGKQFDYINSYGGNDVIYAGDENDRILSGADADSVYGENGMDYLRGGPDSSASSDVIQKDTDLVAGGPGTDLISGGVGDDVLYAGTPGDNIDVGGSNAQGDWMLGGTENDQLIGSVEKDFIMAGAGTDVVLAGAGDDVVLGDGNYDFSLSPSTVSYNNSSPGAASKHTWNGTVWQTQTSGSLPVGQSISIALTPVSHFAWTLGRNGDDFTFQPTAARPAGYDVRVAANGGNDILYGGPGNDWIAGQTGDDFVYGGDGDDTLHGDDAVALPAGSNPGNDHVYGGAGNDRLFGNAGADFLYGELNDDFLVGDGPGESGADTLHGGPGADTLRGADGDDVLYGEDDNDPELNGGNGNDVVYGGKGNDVLQGDGAGATTPGNDTLMGEEGDDQLFGDAGEDILDGGIGHDVLEGGDGDDILRASSGGDTLRGGIGNDRYNFSGFDALFVPTLLETRIEDADGTNRIVFGPFVFPGTVSLSANGSDLLMTYAGLYGARIVGGAKGSVIQEYEFSDGRVFSHDDMISGSGFAYAAINHLATVTDISTGNDYLRGTTGADNIDALGGDDVIFGDEGDDMLAGNDGRDVIDGGPGADIVWGGNGDDRLHGSSGDDNLDGGDGADMLYGGDGADSLVGGAGADRLEGGDGNDTLIGNDGDDVLLGGRGTDSLTGGLGIDTYVFNPGDSDSVGATGITTITENYSERTFIKFEGGIRPQDIQLAMDNGWNNMLTIQFGTSIVKVPHGAYGGVDTEYVFESHPKPITLANMVAGNY